MSSAMSAVLLAAVALGGQPQGVVLDFYSNSCVPCQQMSPIISRLQRQGYSIKKVNIDEHRDLANRFKVNLLPTFVLVVQNQEVSRIVGATSEAQLRRLAQQIPTSDSNVANNSRSNPSSGRFAIAMGNTGLERPALGSPSSFGEPKKSSNSGFASNASAERNIQPKRFLPEPTNGFNPKRDANLSSIPKAPIIRAKRDQQKSPLGTISPEVLRDPMAASVRIRMKDGQITDFGTGTIIDSRPGRTIILTCGHIIRDASKSAKFEVDLFLNGKTDTLIASVVDADYEADVGLLSIPTDVVLPSSHVATKEYQSQVGHGVLNIGCSSGQDPTLQKLKITALNPYQGPDNIECTGLPVPGRSGGGLFNEKNEIVGICIAANEKDNRGLYCGLKPIHQLLEKANLGHIIPSSTPRELPPLLAKSDINSMRDQPFGTSTPKSSPFEDNKSVFASNTPAEMKIANQPSSNIQSLSMSKGSKLTILIDDPNSPSGTRVVIIPSASAKLIADLTGQKPGLVPSTENQTVQRISNSRPRNHVEFLPSPEKKTVSLRTASLRKNSLPQVQRFRRTNSTIAPIQ